MAGAYTKEGKKAQKQFSEAREAFVELANLLESMMRGKATYKCRYCGATFDTPRVERERYEYWGAPAYEEWEVCPECGQGGFEETDETEENEEGEE